MQAHKFPMPLWNATERPLTLSPELTEKLGLASPDVVAGGIIYAPNETLLKSLKDMKQGGGIPIWSEKAITSKFPKALHGPGGQSLSVRNEAEFERALKNGWTEKPQLRESAVDAPPSPDAPPRKMKNVA